jgi:hypothetical protein
MRTRFAALLAVLLVIGVAGTAWGTQGDPLIAGKTNTERHATVIDNPVGDGFGMVINSHDTALQVTSSNGGGDWAMRVLSMGSDGIALVATGGPNGGEAFVAQGPVRVEGAAYITGGVAFGSATGVATVPAGSNHVVVQVATGVMDPGTTGVATMQQHVHGVFVEALVPNPVASTITIYLDKRVSAPVQLAWFLFN